MNKLQFELEEWRQEQSASTERIKGRINSIKTDLMPQGCAEDYVSRDFFESEMSRLKSEHETTIQDLKSHYETEIKDLKSHYTNALTNLEEKVKRLVD